MILSDERLMATGAFFVNPFDPARVQPASIDVTLGDEFLVTTDHLRGDVIDPRQPQDDTFYEHRGDLVLPPGGFALAATAETISCPVAQAVAARIEGKSSLGRLGLAIHITAGYVDPGWVGHITLELKNMRGRPFLLLPGMPIAQASFICLTSAAVTPYGSERLGSKYQHQRGPARPQYHRNFTEARRADR